MTADRLQKVLADAGIASRRRSEALISAGRVTVDGAIVTALGTRADPTMQPITVDGIALPAAAEHVYRMLHKPAGYVSSARDPQGRATVYDLLPPGPRLASVGRLDWESEGLLLFTNAGDLAFRLTHPRFGVEKEYEVWTSGPADSQMIAALRRGVRLEDGWTAPARVRVIAERSSGAAVVSVTIHEGRTRQVRRMCDAIGLPIDRLVRVRFGPLRLGRLTAGSSRALTVAEVRYLRQAVAEPAATREGAKP